MSAVLTHMAELNNKRLTVWKTRPSIHAQKHKGSKSGDDWYKFETGYIKLTEKSKEGIEILLIEDDFDRTPNQQRILIDGTSDDKVRLLEVKEERTNLNNQLTEKRKQRQIRR